MSIKIRKMMASLIIMSMVFVSFGCGKDTSSEESMREELESLRAQLETQVTSNETEEPIEETESVDETVEETEAAVALPLWDLPFTVADGNYNLSVGQISGGQDGLFYTLACVRVLDDIETQVSAVYQYDLPNVGEGEEVVYPIIQIYNASDEVLSFRQQDSISLYVDSVQVTPIDLEGYYFSIDGVKGSYRYDVDPGREAEIVFPFIVNEGWSEITVFCDNASWTFTHDDVSADAYTYASVFNVNPEYSYTEPGTVVYQGDYELIFDGFEVDTTTYTGDVAVFEFTVNNLTDSMLNLPLPSYMRGYQNLGLISSTIWVQADFSGHNNAYVDDSWADDYIEIHPGMSAKIYIAYPVVSDAGTFECFFETEDEGVVAQIAASV